MADTKATSLPSPAVSHDEFAAHLNDHAESSHSAHKDALSEKEIQEAYGEHGPGIDHNIPQKDAVPARPDLWWSRMRHNFREPFSEFFGVFILILFGDGQVLKGILGQSILG